MKILAIDCATNLLSVTVFNGNLFASGDFFLPMEQGAKMLPLVDSLLEKVKLQTGDLEVVAATEGPGSFTGLRLGYSCAKAISFGAGIPFYAVSSVKVRAYPFLSCGFPVVAAIDAKKNRFFCGFFHNGDQLLEDSDLSAEDGVTKISEIMGERGISGPVLVCGEDSVLFAEKANPVVDKKLFCPVADLVSPSRSLAKIAYSMFAEGFAPLEDDAGPKYIRCSDAEAWN
jgi:tRNA threonylcarbamoyladenosine biosynthesis protein TsaB